MTDITKEIYIEDLVREYPRSVRFLAQQGIVCIQCGEPVWGTLEEAVHRVGIDDIAPLLRDLDFFLKENLDK